jgi:phage terminase large subunit GpA-like protein
MKVIKSSPVKDWTQAYLCKCGCEFECNIKDIQYYLGGEYNDPERFYLNCPECDEEFILTTLSEQIKFFIRKVGI